MWARNGWGLPLVILLVYSSGLEVIPIHEERGEFGLERLGELVKITRLIQFVIGLP